MSNLLVLSFFFAILYGTHSIDFATLNYCEITFPWPCKKDQPPSKAGHPACHCSHKKGRVEIGANDTEVHVAFRRKILEVHNEFRDQVAAGRENRTSKASNMRILNYDLELEHIARCRALNSFDAHHEACRFTYNKTSVGQNLWGINTYMDDLNKIKSQMQYWYDEIKDVPEGTVNKFAEHPNTSVMIGHYTQLVWALTTHVGCVRVWNIPVDGWKFSLICNYKPTGNVLGAHMYKEGEPCTDCPKGTKCETEKFPALCGKLEPVPDDAPNPIENRAKSQYLRNWILIIAASFFMVCVS